MLALDTRESPGYGAGVTTHPPSPAAPGRHLAAEWWEVAGLPRQEAAHLLRPGGPLSGQPGVLARYFRAEGPAPGVLRVNAAGLEALAGLDDDGQVTWDGPGDAPQLRFGATARDWYPILPRMNAGDCETQVG